MEDYNDFCGGPFWNTSQFLLGAWPQFSPCFTSICLSWIPCGLLCLVSPWYLYTLRHRRVTLRLPFSRLNASKLICQLSVLFCTLVLLLKRNGQRFQPGSSMSTGEMLSYVIQIFTFTLLIAVGQYERKKSVTASLYQFTFWSVYTLGRIVPAYSMVILKVYEEDTLMFALFYVTFGLCVALTFLNCWSEHPGASATRRGYMQFDEQDPCPMEEASALSSLTMSWIFGLMKIGYKNEIDDTAMWTVPSDVSSEESSGQFDSLWKEEVEGYSHNQGDGMTYLRKSRRDSNGSSIGTSTATTTSSNSSNNYYNSNYNYYNNSISGSIVSKATVMENRIYTEKTRLAKTRLESSPSTLYTQIPAGNAGCGLDSGNSLEFRPKGHQPSLLRALWRLYRGSLALAVVTKLMGDALTVLVPLIFRYLLVYLHLGEQGHSWQGYGLCLLMLLALQFRCFLVGRWHLLAIQSGLSANSALTTAIYKKALTLKICEKTVTSTEDCVHLMTTDCRHIQMFLNQLSHVITTPLLILMTASVTYAFLGPAAIVGVSCMCLLVPIQVLFLLVQTELRNSMSTAKDSRLTLLQEILGGIRVVKLFAWEVQFQSRVQEIRSLEIATLFKLTYCYMVSGVVKNMAIYVAAIVTFGSFILDYKYATLEAESALMVLAYLTYLRAPLEKLAGFVQLSVQTNRSCTRVQSFLLQKEICEDAVTVSPGAEYPIKMDDALLKWDVPFPFKFKRISLAVPQGSLVAIVGPDGCGKSSLLSAMLGEMDRLGGDVSRRGTVAYAPQEPWIQNDTLRENITFGRVYRERKVKAVVSACQLEEELTGIGVDEDSLIGQHGMFLDSGQERRVSLARALYHDCDLYILDEPLKGLGPRVGRAVFSQVMGPKGLLKNKTRIISTNCLHILPAMDMIAVLGQGRLLEMGSFDDLMNHDGALLQFVKDRLIQERLEGEDSDEDEEISSIKDNMWGRVEKLTTSDCTATSGDEGRHRQPRERTISCITSTDVDRLHDFKLPRRKYRRVDIPEPSRHERVTLPLYWHYLSSVGVTSVVASLVTFALYQCSWQLSNVWLALWTCDLDLRNSSLSGGVINKGNDFYITLFLLFGVGQVLFLGCFHFLFWAAIVRACRDLHNTMIERLFKAPFSYFNSTPLGNSLTVFARDGDVVDHILPQITDQLVCSAVQLVGVVVLISVTTPICVILIPVAIAIFVILMKLYIPSCRQLHHLAHNTQSPVNTHFCDTLQGAVTIRAFHEEERFQKEFSRHINAHNSYNFGVNITNRWVMFHLTTLSNIIVFAAGIAQVVFSQADPGLAGLTLFYALQLPSILGRLMTAISGIETNIGSVQRIKQFSEIPQEDDRIKPDSRPSATWPFPGNVEFHEFSMDHLYERKQSLKDIHVRVGGGEKIGVISRAGKEESYVPLSLFRLVEGTKGAIYIDGLDISSIGLHDLRSKLTILPQEPTLFSGSLRFNLDPLEEFNDDQIWSSLARVHLKPYVAQLEERLAFDVGHGGRNLSSGHRQLVCLARTLLRKTSVLVVEEPTTSGLRDDVQQDQFINNIVRMAFQNCTIMTVTHRPQSVINCQRVIVLEDGCVKEFDSPLTLLNNPASTFYSLSRAAGIVI